MQVLLDCFAYGTLIASALLFIFGVSVFLYSLKCDYFYDRSISLVFVFFGHVAVPLLAVSLSYLLIRSNAEGFWFGAFWLSVCALVVYWGFELVRALDRVDSFKLTGHKES